ncbi:MAG: ribosome biogenesis GTP-binding protein YihA/YsxC [Lentimicrobiaceae bacterium]|jgi:GTP-binding protein|nr:ribosome biogenesis GTP-binding protein YihA/YsxC [Lentimicrobiaceae bacterium]
MIIKKAEFLQSNTKIDKLPPPKFPEYAFIGRSNVGKSSLINMLVNKKGLAKTSSTPGKTITINHFIVNDAWYLVDLPGYGFAKRSKKDRELWKTMLQHYLLKRANLVYVFVLIDSRIAPQKNDLEFINWLGESGLPFVLIFTKSDKLGRATVDKNVAAYKKQLLTTWEELPQIIITSSISRLGSDEVLSLIDTENQLFESRNTEI